VINQITNYHQISELFFNLTSVSSYVSCNLCIVLFMMHSTIKLYSKLIDIQKLKPKTPNKL